MPVVIGALVAYTLGWGWNGLFNLAVVRSNPERPGAATGITQTGVFVGAVFGPLLFGFVVDRASYTAAWLVAGVLSLAAAASVRRRPAPARGRPGAAARTRLTVAPRT